MLRVIFRPVKDSLKRIQGATKDRITSRKERANLMKVELVKLGNFIDDLAKEEGMALQPQFWYVPCEWMSYVY